MANLTLIFAVALINATRSTLVINRMTPEEADRLGIADQDRRRFINVSDDKHNRAPAEKADWFQLVGIDLGNGGIGLGDNVAAVAPWTLPDPFDDITTRDLAGVQKAISEGERRENAQAAQWAGKAVATVLGLDAEKKADKSRIKSMLRTWISNGFLRVVEREDKNRDLRKWIETGDPVDLAAPVQGAARQGAAS